MALYSQIPGELNIEVGLGDDLAIVLTFTGIDLTDYTYDSNVVKNGLETETPIIVSGTSTQLSLFLNNTDIVALEAGKHDWYLLWTIGNDSRRALAGYFEIKKYPP